MDVTTENKIAVTITMLFISGTLGLLGMNFQELVILLVSLVSVIAIHERVTRVKQMLPSSSGTSMHSQL
jgi:hypothetical protein